LQNTCKDFGDRNGGDAGLGISDYADSREDTSNSILSILYNNIHYNPLKIMHDLIEFLGLQAPSNHD